jgi:hypothetical protein
MKDFRSPIEKLRTDAAEAALIRDLATDWCNAAFQRLRRYEFQYLVPDVDTKLPRLSAVRMFGRQGTPEADSAPTRVFPLPVGSCSAATRGPPWRGNATVRALGSRGLSQVGGRGARRRARAEAHIRRARRSGVAGGSGGATRRGSRRRAGPCTVAVGKTCPRLPQAGTLIDDRAEPALTELGAADGRPPPDGRKTAAGVGGRRRTILPEARLFRDDPDELAALGGGKGVVRPRFT